MAVHQRVGSEVMKIVDVIKNNKDCVLSHTWLDDLRKHKNDFSEIDTWSTFDQTCINLYFHVDDDQLCCFAKIYNGDSFGGYRKGKRFECLIKLPDDFIESIKENIEWSFKTYLEDEYETYLELKKQQWMEKTKTKLLAE